MKNNLFEIYLTSSFVKSESWLDLILKISKVNGIFKTWKLYINIENNYVRYFVETKKILPPILGNLGEFLIKNTDVSFDNIPNKKFYIPYILTQNYKSILDVYDKKEAKKHEKLVILMIKFYPHKRNSYLSKVYFYFKDIEGNIITRRIFNLYEIYKFISIDFGIHSRFFYKKKEARYLEVKNVINILKEARRNAILKADVFPYLQSDLYLNYEDYDFMKHSVIFGASGTGKSKLLSSIIKNISEKEDSNFKYKVIIIDPHKSIEDDIGGLDKTRVIDFKTDINSVNLFINNSQNILSTTESIMDIFKNIIKDKYNPKLERVLRYSIHTLLNKEKFDLINLKRFLIDIDYRNSIIKSLDENLEINVIEFFRVDFNELKTKFYQEAIAPIVSFIDEMQLLPAFNKSKECIDVVEEIKNNFITIFSLDQMALGLNIVKTISGFIMQAILQLVQTKILNEHIIFVIDEVAIVETPILCRFLSEARKYNLSLFLLGQYFEQITDNLKKAIFTNVINYFIFRVSKADAKLLEGNIKMEVAVNNTSLNRIKILTELDDRECIVRIGKNGILFPCFKGKTLDFTPIPRVKYYDSKIMNICNEEEKKAKKEFDIKANITLKDIMLKQSSSRENLI